MNAIYKTTMIDAEELMEMHWENSKHIGSLVDCEETIGVEVRLNGGEVIAPVIGNIYKSNYAYDSGYAENGETIADLLHRYSKTPADISCVIVKAFGHDDVSGRDHSEWNYKEFIGLRNKTEAATKFVALQDAARKFLDKKLGFSQFKELVNNL